MTSRIPEEGVDAVRSARQVPAAPVGTITHILGTALRKNVAFAIGFVLMVVLVLVAALAPMIAPQSPRTMNPSIFAPSFSPGHLFGTDDLGRDVLSRVIFGTRASLLLALGATSLATVLGVSLGLVTGYYGGILDQVIMRLVDILLSFPALLLAIIIVAMAGPGVPNATLAIGISYAPRFVRIVRGSVLETRERDFCIAAVAMGASDARLLWHHLLRNIVPVVMVYASLVFSYGILAEAGLSFLGLGVQPPTPSWGGMLRAGRSYLELAPTLSVFPGLAIMIAVLAFNLLGDGLRDIIDPRLRGR
jgi:peptide/nickel transport system permease protein